MNSNDTIDECLTKNAELTACLNSLTASVMTQIGPVQPHINEIIQQSLLKAAIEGARIHKNLLPDITN